jgi:hypothetical protein
VALAASGSDAGIGAVKATGDSFIKIKQKPLKKSKHLFGFTGRLPDVFLYPYLRNQRVRVF